MADVVGKLSVDIDASVVPLKQSLNQAEEAAKQTGQKIKQSLDQAVSTSGSGGGSGGIGSFAQQFSRMVDDAQYGFRGIVNNLEGIGVSAGKALGMSASSAAGLGAALTLAGIAINNAMGEIEKLTDTRDDWEKLASSAEAFAGGISMATAQMKLLIEETEKLKKTDATAGTGAALSRGWNSLMAWNNRNRVAGGGDTLLEQIFGKGKSFEEQVQANKDAGRQAQQNEINLGIGKLDVSRQQEFMQSAFKLFDRDRNAAKVEKDKDAGTVFSDVSKGRSFEIKAQLENAIAKENPQMNALDVQENAIKLMGEAASGVKSSFDELAAKLPQLNLAEKLSDFKSIEDIYKEISDAADEHLKRTKELNQAAADEIGQMMKDEMERQGLQKKAGSIQERIDDLMGQRAKSEITSMSSVFEKNLNAGTGEDPVVKAIEKQTEELKQVTRELATLG